MADELKACANTDRELWRETEGDHYAPSIHVNEQGAIGINVGGRVSVRSVRDWHALATRIEPGGVSEADCPFCIERTTFRGDPAWSFCDEHYRQYLATFQIRPVDIAAYRATRLQSLRSEQEGGQ